MNFLNGTLLPRTFLLCTFVLAGCESEDHALDRCLDGAVAQCTPVGLRECGLSNSATDAEFDKCAPYAACEHSALSSCMSQR